MRFLGQSRFSGTNIRMREVADYLTTLGPRDA